ncbi:hypothetical protein H2198_007874 [Neophaeococcomyces mojaviensis]|uniref:Uncharacterized protein n=1 Tax=Neophaeococcomyces mojaviensis TaxID=3383035 RepID=A0ACC2ZYY6_9EURO|nr:hypothetical protein H2198_007874 [Knufia sp. JES_112]
MEVVDKTIVGKALGVLDYTTYSTTELANALYQGLDQLHWVRTLKEALRRGTKFQMMDLAYIFRHSEATDLRDHLFAVLGLVSNVIDPALSPRYKDTILQTCIRYARYWLERKGNLEVLYRAGLNGHKLLAPSWIPNWYGAQTEFKSGYADGLWDPLRRPPFYHVSRGTRPEVHYTSDSTLLGATGVLIDSVADLADHHIRNPPKQPHDKTTMIEIKRQHLLESDRIISTLTKYPTGEDVFEVQWRTLICNVTHGLTKAPASYRDAYQVWRRFLLCDLTLPRSDVPNQLPFRQVIDEYNGDKIFGLTTAGYVGMFPHYARRNDKIAVLYGGEFPFVLREIQNKGQASYELVGQCYVHGLMENGQLDLEELKPKTQTIWLGGDYEIQ